MGKVSRVCCVVGCVHSERLVRLGLLSPASGKGRIGQEAVSVTLLQSGLGFAVFVFHQPSAFASPNLTLFLSPSAGILLRVKH